MSKFITLLSGLKTVFQLVKDVFGLIGAAYDYYKARQASKEDNKKIDKDLKDLADATTKVKKKLEAGEEITKEDNEDRKNAARKFANNFGDI